MLEAAIELIVAKGAERTTLKEVGELAGYSRGLAGYRFGSKAGLFEFVVRSVGEQWLTELTQVTRDKVGFDAISAATDAHYRFCVESPRHVRAFYTLWFESIGPDSGVREVIAGIHERRRKDVAAWIRKDPRIVQKNLTMGADAIAGQYSSTIIGTVYQWLVSSDSLGVIKQLHRHLKQNMKMLLAGT